MTLLGILLVLGQWAAVVTMWLRDRSFGVYQSREEERERRLLIIHEQQMAMHREQVRVHGEQLQMSRELQRLKESA